MRWTELAAAAALVLAGGMARAEEPKWGPHIDLEGKAGTDRHLGEADLFLPVVQNADTLLFANLRARLDDEGGSEGNFGLGVRHMLASGWNLGGYGYFDRRRSDYDNLFNQVTLGAEALGPDWDLRANAYLPVGTRRYEEDSLNTAQISGNSVIFRGGEEKALKGFDAEIGWRVPVFDVDSGTNLRVYGGGYRFVADGVPDVAGPRGRLDLTFDAVPHLWEGSRLSLGAEVQHDDPRGGQGFLSARLRIPLQVFGQPPSKLTPQERRMADPIVRDVDIVSRAGTFGAAETATAANGGAITVLDGASIATTTDLNDALAAANVGSTVILSGTFNTDAAVTLQPGQTVMGAGSVTVRSPSGRTATLARSSGATINATLGVSGTAVSMANDSTLTGMTIALTNGVPLIDVYGVEANGVTGILIANNTVTATNSNNAALGIRLLNGASGRVTGNTVTAHNTNTSGTAIALQILTSTATVSGNTLSATKASGAGSVTALLMQNSTATVSGNTLSAAGSGTANAFLITTSTPLPGSTGNVVLAGSCAGSTSGGPIDYTDAVGASHTCNP